MEKLNGLNEYNILCCKSSISDSEVETDIPINKSRIASVLVKIIERNYKNTGVRIFVEVEEYSIVGYMVNADDTTKYERRRISLDSANSGLNEVDADTYIENVKTVLTDLKHALGMKNLYIAFYYDKIHIAVV